MKVSEEEMKPFLDVLQVHIMGREPRLSKDQILELWDAIYDVIGSLPHRDFSQTYNVEQFVTMLIAKAEQRLGWSQVQ